MIDLRMVARSIAWSRKVLPMFGRYPVTTADCGRLLDRQRVHTELADLPQKFAAVMLPPMFGGHRKLLLAAHVPRVSRHLVLLHEAGHLYQCTADPGITYDSDDWRRPAELAADAYAALALMPRVAVDLALESHIWHRDVEDDLASELLYWSGDLWDEERALVAARHRILIREQLGT